MADYCNIVETCTRWINEVVCILFPFLSTFMKRIKTNSLNYSIKEPEFKTSDFTAAHILSISIWSKPLNIHVKQIVEGHNFSSTTNAQTDNTLLLIIVRFVIPTLMNNSSQFYLRLCCLKEKNSVFLFSAHCIKFNTVSLSPPTVRTEFITTTAFSALESSSHFPLLIFVYFTLNTKFLVDFVFFTLNRILSFYCLTKLMT